MKETNNIVSTDVKNWFFEEIENISVSKGVQKIIDNWKNGKEPTYKQIEAISKNTLIPIGYFLVNDAPQERVPILEYRTIGSKSPEKASRNLIETYKDMVNIQEWLRDYNMEEKDKNNFVGVLNVEKDIKESANIIRQMLQVKVDWFTEKTINNPYTFFKEKMSESGITVMHGSYVRDITTKSLSIEEFRAFALVDDYAPLIFINSNDTKGAMLFSLLHELVHIGIGRNSLYNAGDNVLHHEKREETYCNAVAAEILLPEDVFRKEWEQHKGDWKKLQSYFNCGIVPIARRALDFGEITRTYYSSIVEEATNYAKSINNKARGGDYYTNKIARMDKNLFFAIYQRVMEGRTKYTDAYRLTGTHRGSFDKIVEKLGMSNG